MLWWIPEGEMKEQVLPEDLLCLETDGDCGSGVNKNDRTAETVRGEGQRGGRVKNK